jgi:hypothetical protein
LKRGGDYRLERLGARRPAICGDAIERRDAIVGNPDEQPPRQRTPLEGNSELAADEADAARRAADCCNINP